MPTRPPRPPRSAACLCAACGRVVDAAATTCERCGHARPEAGWKPLGLPRRTAEVVSPDTFDFEGGDEPPVDAPTSSPPGAPTTALTTIIQSPDRDTPALPERAALVMAPPSPSAPASRRRPDPLRVQIAPLDAAEANEEADLASRPYAGRYRVEEALPAAPGTTRHLAVQEPAVRRVILTVLRRGRAADVQQALESRFLRDARVLARLRHPCLAAVHDVGRAADGTCYATEEAPYGPTFGALAAARALPPERLLGVAANIAAALATMHEAGVVHRCVRGDAVVVGHGVWRSGAGELTQLGRYGWHVLPEEIADDDVESARVWPPEVLAGEEPDEAADIYAVGVLLHHALVGRPLHEGTAAEIRAATARGPVHRLVRSDDRIHNRLCDVAERCLAPSPDHRFPSARALLRELEDLSRPPVAEVRPVRAALPWPGIAAAAFAGALVPTLALLGSLAWRSDPPAVAMNEAPPRAAEPAPVATPTATTGAGTARDAAPSGLGALALDVDGSGLGDLAGGGMDAGGIDAGIAVAPSAASQPTPSASSMDARPDTPTDEEPSRPRRRGARSEGSANDSVEPAAARAPASIEQSDAPTTQLPPASTRPDPTPASTSPTASATPPRDPPAATSASPPAKGPTTASPTVPGAAALSGLWVGRAPGGTLALDLVVAADGSVTGRARRGDRAGEGIVVGRVSGGADGHRLELQVTDATGTESYSGEVADGAVSGRIYAGGKPAGRFSAKR